MKLFKTLLIAAVFTLIAAMSDAGALKSEYYATDMETGYTSAYVPEIELPMVTWLEEQGSDVLFVWTDNNGGFGIKIVKEGVSMCWFMAFSETNSKQMWLEQWQLYPPDLQPPVEVSCDKLEKSLKDQIYGSQS